MVWKTNFDKPHYQDLKDNRSQRLPNSYQTSSKTFASTNYQNSVGNNSSVNVIHAFTSNGSVSVSSSSSSQRDPSPLTIPSNESNLNESDPVDLNPTAAALKSAAVAPRHLYTQNRPKPSKNLANTNPSLVSNTNSISTNIDKNSGSILKKFSNDDDFKRSNTQLNNISDTLEHIVNQLDILTQVKFLK